MDISKLSDADLSKHIKKLLKKKSSDEIGEKEERQLSRLISEQDNRRSKAQSDDQVESDSDLSLIELFEKEYLDALNRIDEDVKSLVQNGQELRAIMLMTNEILNIHEIYDALYNIYSIFLNNQVILERFESVRLKQLGYEPIALSKMIKESDRSLDPSRIEDYVLNELNSLGFKEEHWSLNTIFVNELVYLIETLKILVEPNFVPLESYEEEKQEQTTDRYIPSSVKLYVWQRDKGQCVECGSKKRLEYDHIIPVSKGGANTKRNVQLLCERCNRKKASNIQ